MLNSEGVAADEGYGKYVVVVFSDIQSYYDYVAYFYGPEEGSYSLSAGMFIKNGYGHFVLTHQALDVVESIVAHEMTHALLSHLSLPVWVDGHGSFNYWHKA